MFAETGEETTDLEWMLLSGQVEQAYLASALIDQYWGQIIRFFTAVIGDRKAARLVAQAVFQTALLEIYQYRSGLGVRTWLFLLAIEACNQQQSRRRRGWGNLARKSRSANETPFLNPVQAALLALERLNRSERQAVALVFLSGWEVQQAAALMASSPESIQKSIDRFTLLAQRFTTGSDGDSGMEIAGRDDRFAAFLQSGVPETDLTDDEVTEQVHKLLRVVEKNETQRSLQNWLTEAVVVAGVAVAIIGLIWAVRRTIPGETIAKPAALQTVQVTKLVQATPTEPPEPTPVPNDWFYAVEPGDSLSSIAAKFGDFTSQELSVLNRLPLDQKLVAGQKLLLPSRVNPGADQVATPVAYDADIEYESAGIQLSNSNIPEAYQRLQWLASGWQTLWLDLIEHDYGPEGYAGPSRAKRTQAWLSGNQLLVIQGDKVDVPDEAWLAFFDQNKYYVSRPAEGNSWFFETALSELYNSRPIGSSLLELFNPFRADQSPPGRRFEIQETEKISGRQARRINQYNAEGSLTRQLWVDLQTGLVLQALKYSPGGKVIQRLFVNRLAVDVDLPQDLLNPGLPWRGGFADDFLGNLEISPQRWSETSPTTEIPSDRPLPPAPFDPGQAPLSFHYPSDFDGNQAEALVEIFAGEHSLGRVSFGNPWSLICDRSPDGRKLAYVSQPVISGTSDSFLHWIDLTDPDLTTHQVLSGITITQFAFSPDSQYLAAYGHYGTINALYLVDLNTLQPRRVVRLDRLDALSWSEDGAYVAVIGLHYTASTEDQGNNLMIIRLRNGRVFYNAPVTDIPARTRVLDRDWSTPYPLPTGGLESCVN